MTNTKPYLLAALILFSLPACIRIGSAQGIDPNTSFKTEVINDPSLGGMKAFTVSIPSDWQFQGTVIAPLRYSPPSPVFRAYSADGLTEIRVLPAFSWQILHPTGSEWEGLGKWRECIYLNSTMTARQFLDRYVRTLGSPHVLGTMSISAGYRRQLDKSLSRANAIRPKDQKMRMKTTGDAAALRLETSNGTFTIEQRLRARVVCMLWPKTIAGRSGGCFASLDVLRAPKGQLDALVRLVDSHNLTIVKDDDRWRQDVMAQLTAAHENRFGRYQPNRAAMEMLQRQAREFGLDPEEDQRRVEESREPEVRPHRVTWARVPLPDVVSDWADFALDPKPVADDHGVVHLSDPVHAWSSSNGQRYRTGNPGANPNGVMSGRWTEDLRPHKKGQQQ